MNSVSAPQTLELPLNLTEVDNKPVLLDFDGGQISSDGGLLLLREVEQQIGIIKSLTEVIHDARDARYVRHTIMDLMMPICCSTSRSNNKPPSEDI